MFCGAVCAELLVVRSRRRRRKLSLAVPVLVAEAGVLERSGVDSRVDLTLVSLEV